MGNRIIGILVSVVYGRLSVLEEIPLSRVVSIQVRPDLDRQKVWITLVTSFVEQRRFAGRVYISRKDRNQENGSGLVRVNRKRNSVFHWSRLYSGPRKNRIFTIFTSRFRGVIAFTPISDFEKSNAKIAFSL